MSNLVTAQRVQLHRVRLGLSPEQYGIHIGCCGMTVRRVEDGCRPFLNTQKKFAAALGVEIDELWPPITLASRRRKKAFA